MNKIIVSGTILLAALTLQSASAQSALDVLRLSNQTLIGTGRAAGTNTTMGGIGGDFTSLSSNPAGIAQYRLSEIMISPTVVSTGTTSQLLGGSEGPESKDSKTKFRLPNLGLVIASQKNPNLSYAFGFGINGYTDNSQNAVFSGKSAGSITERFAAIADEVDYGQSPYEADLADDAGVFWTSMGEYVRDPDGTLVYDYKDYRESRTELDKYQTITAKGRYNDVTFSGGVNLSNKLLVGVSVGIPSFRYNERKLYQERDDADIVPFFDQLQFREYKVASGVGINGKLGLIFKPVNSLLIGAAIHSPSFIAITDNFSTDFLYEYTDNGKYSNYVESPEGTIDYTVTTPMKLMGSIGGIIGKYGFINAEVEYQDFSKGRMRIDSDNLFDKQVEDQINGEVKANYTSAIKVNFGAEVAAIQNFRIRAGIGFAQSPYVDQRDFHPNFGFGVGYKTDYFFMDLAYRQWRSENGYQPYYISEASQTLVNQQIVQNAFVLTLGFKLY